MFFRKKSAKISRRKALLVGINYNGTADELRGCINDTTNMAMFLKKRGFKDNEIRILSENADDLPTKHNIIKGLKWLLENEKDEDMTLVFQYSGHGSWVYDKNNDEEDGRDECLVPLDYKKNGMLFDDDLKILLEENMTSNNKLFAIIDACHSGTMLDLKHNIKFYNAQQGKFKLDLTIENHKNSIKGQVIALSGCEDKQKSIDAKMNRKFQGVLTYAFLLALKEIKRQEETEDYMNIMQYIYKTLKTDYSYKQNPSMSSNKTIVLENKFLITDK